MISTPKTNDNMKTELKYSTNVHSEQVSPLTQAGGAAYSIGTRLFGVYSPEDDLLAVHATEEGADDNKANYEKQHGEGFYVDYVMLQA